MKLVYFPKGSYSIYDVQRRHMQVRKKKKKENCGDYYFLRDEENVNPITN